MPREEPTLKPNMGATKNRPKNAASKAPTRPLPSEDSPSSSSEASDSFGEASDGADGEWKPASKYHTARLLAQTPTKPLRRSPRIAEKNRTRNPVPADLSPVVISPSDSDVSPDSTGKDGFPWDASEPRGGAYAVEGYDGTPLTSPKVLYTEAEDRAQPDESVSRRPKLRRGLAGVASVKMEEEELGGGEEVEEDIGKNPRRKLFADKIKVEVESEEEDVGVRLDVKGEDDDADAKVKKEEDEDGSIVESDDRVVEAKKEEDREDDIKDTAKSTSAPKPLGFRFEDSRLHFIVPFDVHKRYLESPRKCVACKVKAPTVRCGKTHGHARKRILKIAFASLSKCAEHYRKQQYDELVDVLETFLNDALCNGHRNTAGYDENMGELKRYLKRLLESKNRADLEDGNLAFTAREFEAWIEGISRSTDADALSGKPQLLRTNSNEVVVAELWQPKIYADKPASEAIFNTLWKTLEPMAYNDGYIYVLTHHSTNFFKVGYSKDCPNKRTEAWDTCCGRHHAEAKLPNGGRVLHARRVEKLIHAELKNVRIKVKCEKEKLHCEWFGVYLEDLEKIFLKWQGWINEKPYVEDFGNIWRLRRDVVDKLKGVCEPLDYKPTFKVVSGKLVQLRLEPVAEEDMNAPTVE